MIFSHFILNAGNNIYNVKKRKYISNQFILCRFSLNCSEYVNRFLLYIIIKKQMAIHWSFIHLRRPSPVFYQCWEWHILSEQMTWCSIKSNKRWTFHSSHPIFLLWKTTQFSVWQTLVKCQVSEGASGMWLVTECVKLFKSMCTVQWVDYADQIHTRKVGKNCILVFPSRC